MQDNYAQDINPEWVEEGWSGMKQLLDREMPVAAQRRPAAWFWRAAATAGLFGLLGALWYAWPAPPSPELGQLPVLLSGNIASARPANATATEAAVAALADEAGSTPPPTPAAPAPARPAAPLRQTRPAVLDDPRSQQLLRPGGNEEVVPQSPKPVLALQPGLDQLPTRPGAITTADASAEMMPTSNSAQLPAVWQVGLTGGGWAEPASGALGYEAGLFLAFRPHRSSWYGRATATYQASARRRTLSEHAFMYTIEEAPETAGGPASYLLTSTTDAQNFQWAALSVHAGYTLLPRLGLEAGLFGSFLAAAQQTNSWTLPPGQNTPNNQDVFADGTTGRYQSTAYASRTGLKHWQGGWSLGLKYHYSTKTFVTLQYRSNGSDILESPGLSWHFRSVALSLSHGF